MDEQRTRDDRILDHIGLYRLSLRPVLERLFFDGKSSGNVMQRLLKQDRVVSRDGLPRRMRYYQLSSSETKKRSFPVGRSRPFGAQAINIHLGVLWFCCMDPSKRHLAEDEPLRRQFGDDIPSGPHCIERSAEKHCLLKIRVASAEADDASIIRTLRQETAAVSQHAKLGQPLRARQYAFTVLVDTKTRVKALDQSVEESGLREDALVTVAFAPSHLTLHEALQSL